MHFDLPEKAFVHKFIPKSRFFSHNLVNTKVKDDFAKLIKRITWEYKLAESTIGIDKTKQIEEIQIFFIELKEQTIPKNIIKIIDKAIPYPILYVFTYNDNIAYGIVLKDKSNPIYYFSNWNEEFQFEFGGLTLEKVYQNLIRKFITSSSKTEKDFVTLVHTDQRVQALEKDILMLESKIRKEKQFNRKVELNKALLNTKKELSQIKL